MPLLHYCIVQHKEKQLINVQPWWEALTCSLYVQASCVFSLLCAPCSTCCSLLSWVIKSRETIHVPLVLLEPQVVCKFAAVVKSNIDIFSPPAPPPNILPCFVWMTSKFWILTFISLSWQNVCVLLNNVQLMNERYEICCSGAVWGARREDSGDVCLRLWQIFKTWRHWRGEDSHEHHWSWVADRGVAGSGECRSRGGAGPLLISILHYQVSHFLDIFFSSWLFSPFFVD